MTISNSARILPTLGASAQRFAKASGKSLPAASGLGSTRLLTEANSGGASRLSMAPSAAQMRTPRISSAALGTTRFASTRTNATEASNVKDLVKTPADSAISQHIYKVFPNDLNSNNSIFGGVVMATCDRLALVVAERHSGKACVTVSVDSFHFLSPARKGETLVYSAAVNRAWGSSMEIGVRVRAENSMTGESRHIDSAYFTFVALDEAGKPAKVPQLRPTNAKEARRYEEAQLRRDARLETRNQIKAYRDQEASSEAAPSS